MSTQPTNRMKGANALSTPSSQPQGRAETKTKPKNNRKRMSTPEAPSPRSSLGLLATRAASFIESDSQYLPWKIAFRVQFHTEKFGIRFHPAQYPDTGNGVYTIRVLDIAKGPDGQANGPAQQYNSSLAPEQQHLALRPGLYLTHINDMHLVTVPCQTVINSLQTVKRPVVLRFVDVEAGVVTPHELRENEKEQAAALVAIAQQEQIQTASPTATTAKAPAPISPTLKSSEPIYKIILLGATGVGKSSMLAVGVNGDSAYTERRATTIEAEFGTMDIADPDISISQRIKARIWDTAGQERYRAITRSHYRRADGALLVYDVADPDSFEKLAEWLKTLKETAGDSLKSIMVVENKIDQLPERLTGKEIRPSHFVQEASAQRFCQENSLLFARTSAKMNAVAFRWEGQKVADVVSHLILSVHATKLSRHVSANNVLASLTNEMQPQTAKEPTQQQQQLPPPPPQEHDLSGNTIVLKDGPVNPDQGIMQSQCSSCT